MAPPKRRPRDPERFPAADHALTDEEIEDGYGGYVAAALEAIASDPSYGYLIDFAKGAAGVERRLAAGRKAAQTRHAPRKSKP